MCWISRPSMFVSCPRSRTDLLGRWVMFLRGKPRCDQGVPAHTETASDFFPRFGFRPTQRAAVDSAVQKSVEFTSACPASTHVLVATLDEAAELRAANHIPFELPIVTDAGWCGSSAPRRAFASVPRADSYAAPT